jgi:hypothetical protein
MARQYFAVPGKRNESDIEVPVSVADGSVSFDVPTAGRLNRCAFSLDIKELREALDAMEGLGKQSPAIHLQGGSVARERMA